MANTYITMNSVVFSPTTVEVSFDKIGTTKRAANGKLYFYFRAIKRKWSISWTALPEANLAAIRALGALTSSFTFIDEHGTSYTVVVPPGGYSAELSAERRSLAGVFYYDVSLELEEV